MSLLDAELIRETAACEGLSVDIVDETGSTNQALMDAPFGDGPAPPRLLAAVRQTAGRGRRGRAWLSPDGRSAAFSIAFERPVRLEPPPAAVPVAVGAAVASALSRWAPDLRLKWPNDLQRARRKLGGILIECRRGVPAAAPGRDPIERIVVGIGLNLLAPPDAPGIAQPACGLFDGQTLPAHAAETVIGALAAAVVPAVRRFLFEGLAPFLETWRSFDALDGEQVALVDGDRVLATGRAVGLDDSGGLRVQTADGLRVLSGGEVSLRRLDPVH
ncbi:MAG: biotin--[acetyl-CoA-carboxylase] ligase [Burkholderiales bacterium]|nr:MAG: biotin--[acetyl-CoA-carboxylase] ligase [Burkholderiales bacterium]